MRARRCLICGRINPCPDHSAREQDAELSRNLHAINKIKLSERKGR